MVDRVFISNIENGKESRIAERQRERERVCVCVERQSMAENEG
jgi:hypothetical protein